MKSKRMIYTTLLILWMLIIFMFSNQDSTKSESTSDKLTGTVIDTVEVVTKEEISEDKKDILIEDSRFIVRKTAHFTLYFILGILSYLTIKSYGVKRVVLLSILFCFIYACSDEFHQMFLDGRTPKILDILIDTIGSSVGIYLLIIFNEKILKKDNKVINN